MSKSSKPSHKPKLKKSPPSPHVEVISQSGLTLPVDAVTIKEDDDGICLIQVEVRLPVNATFYRNDYVTSGFRPTDR